MIWALLGTLAGIIIGLQITYTIPVEFTKYTAVIVVGILDALFGAVKAEVTKDDYSSAIFISGIIFNILLAVAITLLGEKLGIELYLAVTVVFTFRIFANLAITRRAVLRNMIKKKD